MMKFSLHRCNCRAADDDIAKGIRTLHRLAMSQLLFSLRRRSQLNNDGLMTSARSLVPNLGANYQNLVKAPF